MITQPLLHGKTAGSEDSLLKDRQISIVATDVSYARGVSYYKQGMVVSLEPTDETHVSYRAKVTNPAGTDVYDVRVRLSKSRSSIESYACTCPAADRYLGACKHVVAVLKEIQDDMVREQETGWIMPKLEKEESGAPQTNERGRQMFRYFSEEGGGKAAAATKPLTPARAYLVPKLHVEYGYAHTVDTYLSFRIGEEKLYVLRNIENFCKAMEKGEDWLLGKKNVLHTENLHWADDLSQKMWTMVSTALRDEDSMFSWTASPYYSTRVASRFSTKMFYLTPGDTDRFFEAVGDMPLDIEVEGFDTVTARRAEGLPRLDFWVEESKKGEGGSVRLEADEFFPLTADCRYICQLDEIYHIPADRAEDYRRVMEAFDMDDKIRLSEADMARFFSEIMPTVERVTSMHIASGFFKRYQIAPLSAGLYIDYAGDGIAVKVEFVYGDERFNPMVSDGPVDGDKHLVRNKKDEDSVIATLRAYGFRKDRDQLVQKDEDQSYDFLTEALPQMPDWVDVYYADAFQQWPVRPMPKVTAGVSVNDSDLLEVTFDTKGIDIDELFAILDSYRQKRRYHRMKDKSFVTLSDNQLAGLATLADDLGIKDVKKGEAGSAIEIPLANALYLDQLARDDEAIEVRRSQRFRSIVRGIRHPENVDVDIPKHLENVLRDYQVTGVGWLTSLAAHHLGGILADDMGLGKTLQVLTFLATSHEADAPPSLVVAPTSLLYNWLDEVERFTPELTAYAVTGTKAEREQVLDEHYADADLLVTTYNMVRRDIALYEKKKFRYVFLDEAQHIKNPGTQAAHAVKKLHMAGSFALTGTPIENTLTELWSLFDFLMPGYLFGHAKFKQRFETPIVRAEDEKALVSLRRHVAPFILRRMKKDVLKELPDKVERKLVGDMTPEQEKIYQAWFLKSQKEFAQTLKEHGFGESRIKILAILTRLRQIACDPGLFLESYTGGSGKLDMLEELVEDAREGGHRMLIFSQFTSMLRRIEDRLRKKGVECLYLDGSTPALSRISLVKSFNSGTVPVFLISLKAGGTGLNLTGADMVIHFDPWWNPAVEDQATDRAYRLGQKNNVQVVKLITKGTVEEKIYKLQEKKKGLIDQMIQPGENFLSKLTEDEIRALFER